MKNKKIFLFLIAFIIIMFIVCSKVFALHPGEVLIGDNIDGTEELKDFGNKALGVIQTIGVVSSVIILMVCGLKYMTGSVEEKAGYKKALVPYVVGAVLLFAVPTAVNVVYEFAGGGDINLAREVVWLCPKGNEIEISERIEGGEMVIVYSCSKKDCECEYGYDENPMINGPENDIIRSIRCPKCKVELTGSKQNHCPSCGKYYKQD